MSNLDLHPDDRMEIGIQLATADRLLRELCGLLAGDPLRPLAVGAHDAVAALRGRLLSDAAPFAEQLHGRN